MLDYTIQHTKNYIIMLHVTLSWCKVWASTEQKKNFMCLRVNSEQNKILISLQGNCRIGAVWYSWWILCFIVLRHKSTSLLFINISMWIVESAFMMDGAQKNFCNKRIPLILEVILHHSNVLNRGAVSLRNQRTPSSVFVSDCQSV